MMQIINDNMKQSNRIYIPLLMSFCISNTSYSKDSYIIESDKNKNKSEKPDIIMILVDDMGYSDLGCYGGEINTPNLDNLALKGMRFTQMHNTAKCFPSRACLLTGLYAQQNGMSENPENFINAVSIGDLLRTEGYRTLFSGKNHVKRAFTTLDSIVCTNSLVEQPTTSIQVNNVREKWPQYLKAGQIYGT